MDSNSLNPSKMNSEGPWVDWDWQKQENNSPAQDSSKAIAWEFGGAPGFSSGEQKPFPFTTNEKIQSLAYQISSFNSRENGRLIGTPIRDLTPENFAKKQSFLHKMIFQQNQAVLAASNTQSAEEANLTKAATPEDFLGIDYACGQTIKTVASAWSTYLPTEPVSQHFQGHFQVFGKQVTYLALSEGDKEAVDFCKEKLADCIRERLELELENSKNSYTLPVIRDALAISTVDLNNSFPLHGKKQFKGVSINVSLIYEGRLWVLNLGNTRAMLVSPHADITPLTVDNPKLRIGLPMATRAQVCFIDCPEEGWKGHHLIQTTNGIHKGTKEQTVALRSFDVGWMLHNLHNQSSTPLLQVARTIIVEAHEKGGTGNLHVAITPLEG